MDSLENTETILEELIPSTQIQVKNSRKKRAPFEFVAKINKILFGTMDSEDAERINSQIEALGNTTLELTEILQNQTHIIKSAFETMRKNIESLAESIKKETEKLKIALIAIRKEVHTIEQNQRAIQFATQIEESLTELELDIETLVNAVLFAKIGQIHPKLLTTKKILLSAEAIKRSSPNTEFPVPLNSEHVSELMELTELSVFHNGEKLVYVIKIPLLDLSIYKLYQHLSLPIRQISTTENSKFAYIKPAIQYTAISSDFASYFSIENLDECMTITNQYICKQTYPIRQINDESECEIQLLINPQFDNLESCDIRLKTLKRTYWIKIRNANAWLFAAPRAETLYFICNDRDSVIRTITNSGMLQIEPFCQVKTRTTTLTPTTELTSSIEIDFPHTPVLNITEIIQKATVNINDINITEILAETETITGLSNMESVQDDLTQNEVALKAIIAKTKEISKSHYLGHRVSTLESIFKYGGISVGSILLIATIGWKLSLFNKISGLWKILSCVKKYRKHPKLIDESHKVSYYRQPIELVEAPKPITTTNREIAIITETPAQIEHRPMYALTYLNRDELP